MAALKDVAPELAERVKTLFVITSYSIHYTKLYEASYFAEGFVIISIRSMVLAGICSKFVTLSTPPIPEILPFIIIKGFFPLMVKFPSISTCTPGIFFIKSAAVPPICVKFSDAFTTIPSSVFSYNFV